MPTCSPTKALSPTGHDVIWLEPDRVARIQETPPSYSAMRVRAFGDQCGRSGSLARAKQTLPKRLPRAAAAADLPHPDACLTCDHSSADPKFLAVHHA